MWFTFRIQYNIVPSKEPPPQFRLNFLSKLIALLFTAGAIGCATHDVNPSPSPLIEPPQTYSVEMEGGELLEGPWWQVFDDATLNSLIETALSENFTVAQAAERIVRAESLLIQANALRKPSINLSGQAERSRQRQESGEANGSNNEIDRIATARQNIAQAVAALPDGTLQPAEIANRWLNSPLREYIEGGEDDWQDSYESVLGAGVTFQWELDLWGRLRANAAKNRAEVAAFWDDYDAIRLQVASQVAQTYFQALEQRLQWALLMQQKESAETFLELIELRLRHGNASSVDILQQRGQIAEVNSEIPVVESQLRILENRLDVLLGEAPDGIPRTETEIVTLPHTESTPNIGVPVELLQHRPDLRALQRRIVGNDYQIAVVIAERLPRLTLNGSFSYDDLSSADTVLAFGSAELFQPLLDWGQRKAAVAAARSTFRESLLAYTERYLLAIEEAESALWREARQRELIRALEERIHILEQTVTETRFRYSLGVTDYLPVLTAIQELQEEERALLTQRRILVSLRVELFRAAGGPEWKIAENMQESDSIE